MKKVFALLLFVLLSAWGVIAMSPRATPYTPPHAPTRATLTCTQTFTPTVTIAPTVTPLVACIVASDGLNVRTCAGISCAVRGDLSRGQVVKIARFLGKWAEILPAGWVNSAFLTCK